MRKDSQGRRGGSIDSQRRMNGLCDLFEEELIAGKQPRIEDYLSRVEGDPSFLKAIFLELLLTESEYSERQGLAWSLETYRERFPDLVREVESDDATQTLATTNSQVASLSGDRKMLSVQASIDQLTFHAKGGLGEVYRGFDRTLRRTVAVKFIRQSALSERTRQRFLMEAEITGRLDHPGVVPVYGLGVSEGGDEFLVMRFVDGKTLLKAVDDYHRMPERPAANKRRELVKLLGHFVAACHTIAYAHARGILHRDVKPENIMIGRYHETLVVDWGLALPIDRLDESVFGDQSTLRVGCVDTPANEVFLAGGTPGYVSPEAVCGNSYLLGPRSDVYSLGATLYHILVGRKTVRGTLGGHVVEAIKRGDFPRPRELNPAISPALEAICLKAMSLEAGKRYHNAVALASDIEAFISDEPVVAMPESSFDRLRRGARRHRALTTAVVVFAVCALTTAMVASVVFRAKVAREMAAAVEADKAALDGLQLAARFAAETIAGEIDIRWRVLEALASDEKLRAMLAQLDGTPQYSEWPELQARLENLLRRYADLDKDSVFLCDKRGVQVARVPFSGESIGGDFSSRDYFHGHGSQDSEGDDAGSIVTAPHISTSYISKSDQRQKLSFSLPIFPAGVDGGDNAFAGGDESLHPVGVIGMSMPAGGFYALQKGLRSGQLGVLVDTRLQTVADGEDARGLILHHPSLRDVQTKELAVFGAVQPRFVPEAFVGRFNNVITYRNATLEDTELDNTDESTQINVLTGFPDVLDTAGASSWVAAFEPVIVRGRPKELRSTGLVVLVQQLQAEHAASVAWESALERAR